MPKRTLDLLEALTEVPFKPKQVIVGQQTFPYMRLEIPVPSLPLLSWLKEQTLYPKVYFENPRTHSRIAAVGEAFSMNEIPSFGRLSAAPRFFGGMDFFERKTKTWGSFPSCRYTLPLIEMEEREGMTYLCFNRVNDKPLPPLHFKCTALTPWTDQPMSRLDAPSFPVWDRHIRESLSEMSRQAFDKIVLARATLFEFEEALDPFAVCQSLQGKSETATLFAFQFSPQQAFVGATPEFLYSRKHRLIETAAIAGTRPRGKTAQEDQALQKELLSNTKELHEFHVVKSEVETRLAPLCTSLSQALEDKVIQTSTVQHICHRFEGTLKEGIDDQSLIKALHPTPAVGGHPKEIALKEIRKRETFDRGWYAAPVGWISPDASHLLVAIRSALIQGNQLRLFAGTGIVPGSAPEKEWAELEHKISQFSV